jgi:hypothetical protein
MKNYLTKEEQKQIERYCNIKFAIEENYTPLKTVDVVYFEKRGWKKIFDKVDPKLFDESRVEHFSEILDTVDTTKIQYCVHNVSGKRYRINQKSKMFRHKFGIELEQELEEQA